MDNRAHFFISLAIAGDMFNIRMLWVLLYEIAANTQFTLCIGIEAVARCARFPLHIIVLLLLRKHYRKCQLYIER